MAEVGSEVGFLVQIPLREIASQMRKNAQIFAFVSTKYCGFLRFFALTQAILIARKFAIYAIQIAQKAFFLRNFACESQKFISRQK